MSNIHESNEITVQNVEIDVSKLVFTDIEYDLNEEDVEREEAESVEALQDSLPKIIRINIPSKYRRKILTAIKREDLKSCEEIYDWFSDETGWCLCDATISTIDGKYSE